MNNIGVVIIGRNEGERLKTCVRSLSSIECQLVYVESDSTDQSVEFVSSQGFDVINLDMSIPFSAGRARNEGYRYLLQKYPLIEFIQFVDGDCEVQPDWIEPACAHLIRYAELAAVCGRCRELYPDATIYNQLCGIEWDTPVGSALATGVNALFRAQALTDVNGFSSQVIAGEEPEMCLRMMHHGWKIERLGVAMVLHDANIKQISQW